MKTTPLAQASERRGESPHGISHHRLRLLEDIEALPQYLTRVAVKTGDRILLIRVDRIQWVEAEDNYIILHVGNERHMVRQTLGAFEVSVDPKRFFRVNRSALVNMNYVAELRCIFRGEYVVVLTDGRQLSLTRDVHELEEQLQFA
jgi:two-component system LytT family response regulator